MLLGFMSIMMFVLAGDELAEAKGLEKKSASAVMERDAGKLLGEVVLSIRTVASFNAETRFFESFQRNVETVRKLDHCNALKGSIAMAFSMPLFVFMMAAMYAYDMGPHTVPSRWAPS